MYRPQAPQQHPEVDMPEGSARFRAQASKGAAFLGGSAGGDCARNPLAQVDARRAVQALPQSGLHAAVRGGIARNPRTIINAIKRRTRGLKIATNTRKAERHGAGLGLLELLFELLISI